METTPRQVRVQEIIKGPPHSGDKNNCRDQGPFLPGGSVLLPSGRNEQLQEEVCIVQSEGAVWSHHWSNDLLLQFSCVHIVVLIIYESFYPGFHLFKDLQLKKLVLHSR